ncbi:hypothetical protein FHG87_002880 [Trinorchestia longiramus]|nr:hypothetical protein FHG87_002880 [Trinorchestia longiramus]
MTPSQFRQPSFTVIIAIKCYQRSTTIHLYSVYGHEKQTQLLYIGKTWRLRAVVSLTAAIADRSNPCLEVFHDDDDVDDDDDDVDVHDDDDVHYDDCDDDDNDDDDDDDDVHDDDDQLCCNQS